MLFNCKTADHEPLVGMKKDMGASHKASSPKISHNFPDDNRAVLVKPKQACR